MNHFAGMLLDSVLSACALWLPAVACTSADRATAARVVDAAGPALCALVPLFDGPDLAAVLCADAARTVGAILAATVKIQEKGAPAPPCVMVPLGRVGGDPRELVCAHRRGDVERALRGGK